MYSTCFHQSMGGKSGESLISCLHGFVRNMDFATETVQMLCVQLPSLSAVCISRCAAGDPL